MTGFSVSGGAGPPLLGIAVGLVLLARGLVAYRSALRVSGIATSDATGIAAGEVRVTGEVEAGDTTLVSPLQSLPCVYYRALASRGSGDERQVLLDEARSVSFRLRDASGAVTVFPRGARWEVPARLDGNAVLGEAPLRLDLNRGARYRATPLTREQQIAELLTVQGSDDAGQGFDSASGYGDGDGVLDRVGVLGSGSGAGDAWSLGSGLEGASRYRESVVEPGDVVTVVGTAVPFGEMPDLAESEDGIADPLDDPEIAADLEVAQAAGLVVGDAATAWGNAAIPGFGIGRPTRQPVLDPGARPEPVVRPAADDDATPPPGWDLEPGTLVVAGVAGRPLTIWSGTPAQASARTMQGFWIGLGGAMVAVASTGWLLVGGGL